MKMLSALFPVLPLLNVVVFAMVLLVLDLFKIVRFRLLWSVFACIGTIIILITQFKYHGTFYSDLIAINGFTTFFQILIWVGTLFAVLLSHRNLAAQKAVSSVDINVLLLLASCGAMVMVGAANLIVLFIGFELMSVIVYALSGIAKNEKASAEGALKYFILGSFSSAFLLYGMVLVYAATGTMQIAEIAQAIPDYGPLLLLGLGLLMFGFCFKISAVPFHFWAPDVYQGAPTSITAYMAVVVKIAAFGTFVRLMHVAFGGIFAEWQGFLWLICILTMTVGNLMALKQQSIKRMLAYSSISHAGYALIGLLANSEQGMQALTYYLIAYLFMSMASFGVVLHVTSSSDYQYDKDTLNTFSGLGWTHPVLGIMMTIALLSLAGMPPLAGFIGKFYLFTAAINSGYVGLAIIAALNSVVSMYYYLRVIVAMYFTPLSGLVNPAQNLSLSMKSALFITTAATIYLGIFANNCVTLVKLVIN